MGATLDTRYLYGQLNNYVEYLRYDFSSTDGTLFVSTKDDYKIDLSVNTTNLITLKQVKKDNDPSDDPIKYYSLYAYNNITKDYDIKIGQEIVVDTSLADDIVNNVEKAFIKVGEQQKYENRLDENGLPVLDSEGNEIKDPVYDSDGNPVMIPIYQEVIVDVNQSGQLVLDKIPASAIVDEHEDGTRIESVLDGNNGGEVY